MTQLNIMQLNITELNIPKLNIPQLIKTQRIITQINNNFSTKLNWTELVLKFCFPIIKCKLYEIRNWEIMQEEMWQDYLLISQSPISGSKVFVPSHTLL